MERIVGKIKGCGRNEGGKNEKELGLCPAAADESFTALMGALTAAELVGMAGTFCHGEVQGTFARKLQDCTLCNFFSW